MSLFHRSLTYEKGAKAAYAALSPAVREQMLPHGAESLENRLLCLMPLLYPDDPEVTTYFRGTKEQYVRAAQIYAEIDRRYQSEDVPYEEFLRYLAEAAPAGEERRRYFISRVLQGIDRWIDLP